MQIAHWFVHQDTSILFALLPAPSLRASILLLCAGREVRRGRISHLNFRAPPRTACTPALKAGLVSKANGMGHLRKVVMDNNACYNDSSCLLCPGCRCECPPVQPSWSGSQGTRHAHPVAPCLLSFRLQAVEGGTETLTPSLVLGH